MTESDSAELRLPATPDVPGFAQEPDEEMSQEEQARLLVEPSFDHEVGDEEELLHYEFGPPDEAGYYGRVGRAPVGTVEPPSKAGPR